MRMWTQAVPAFLNSTPQDILQNRAQQAAATGLSRVLDPLIQMAQDVSYPLCVLMMLGGWLLIMVGQRSKGTNAIKWAAIGFVGIKLVPWMMSVVLGLGQAVGP